MASAISRPACSGPHAAVGHCSTGRTPLARYGRRDGTERWESSILSDVLPFIRRSAHVEAAREQTFLGGLSIAGSRVRSTIASRGARSQLQPRLTSGFYGVGGEPSLRHGWQFRVPGGRSDGSISGLVGYRGVTASGKHQQCGRDRSARSEDVPGIGNEKARTSGRVGHRDRRWRPSYRCFGRRPAVSRRDKLLSNGGFLGAARRGFFSRRASCD